MTLREVSPLELFGWEALRYLTIALFIVVPSFAAFWAWAAYRNSKKCGYVWLAVFALTPYFACTLSKASNWIFREELAKARTPRSERVVIV